MENLILRNYQSPGDIVMLTAAVRDLHRCYPGRFSTDVRTSAPALWENNPLITQLQDSPSGAREVECHYPLIHQSNQRPYHFLHGFIHYLNDVLDLRIVPTEFRGDIYLSDREKGARPHFENVALPDNYWLVVAGGKYDFTTKWWSPSRMQEVVDDFARSVDFVQVGERDHYHPPLRNVVDLRGRTSLRQLVHLVHYARGVICPVTLLMHLAAAVETPSGHAPHRACVVIAGGREPPHWEAYPFHQYLHTVGMLDCCANGGCWRSRVHPLGDGDEKDSPPSLCLRPVGDLPRCMDMITADHVKAAVNLYHAGDGHR